MSAGYSKLFSTIWNGTLYGRFEASATMMLLLSLCDADGIVDATIEAIAGRTGWPIEFIRQGIAELEQPDPQSRTPAADGRRILRLDEHRNWGWSIANYSVYRERARTEERREHFRAAKRQQRARNVQDMSGHVETKLDNPECPQCPPIAEAEAKAEAKAKADAKPTTAASQPTDGEFQTFKKAYPKRAGSQPWSQARKAIHARLKHGNTMAEILAGAQRYQAYAAWTAKEGTEFVLQAVTFCGPEKHFLESWKLPAAEGNGKTKGQRETTERFLANTEERP